ncbi:MAG: DUF805 domain-containing protein [Robiginitomaculum sp.]
MGRVYKLFFSPRGRITRIAFIVGVVGILAFYLTQKWIFLHLGSYLGTGMFTDFFLPMLLFFITLHMILCIYGKRLHDMGKNLWPLTGVVFLSLSVLFFLGLHYGMLEYFETIHGFMNDPKLQDDPITLQNAIKPVEEVYQNNLRNNMKTISALASILPVLFTAWLALWPGEKNDNIYGASPTGET